MPINLTIGAASAAELLNEVRGLAEALGMTVSEDAADDAPAKKPAARGRPSKKADPEPEAKDSDGGKDDGKNVETPKAEDKAPEPDPEPAAPAFTKADVQDKARELMNAGGPNAGGGVKFVEILQEMTGAKSVHEVKIGMLKEEQYPEAIERMNAAIAEIEKVGGSNADLLG